LIELLEKSSLYDDNQNQQKFIPIIDIRASMGRGQRRQLHQEAPDLRCRRHRLGWLQSTERGLRQDVLSNYEKHARRNVLVKYFASIELSFEYAHQGPIS
jgi:hypothetical protein